MEVWGPVLLGSALTVLANLVGTAYFAGKLTATVTSLDQWKRDDADPMLNDHASRIASVEGQLMERRRSDHREH